ncbi:hypothetical protein HNP48_002288 [Acidovorax soli]|uniref:ERF superfamily protein n=1 Tax=Acidovorax soli TaxID=592050 RepID=A0A7X0U8Y7_9BURK|nr:ERF family protein [Acidovorax soli]MBB6559621.1 hypothetical protein [Acidovorax soli]
MTLLTPAAPLAGPFANALAAMNANMTMAEIKELQQEQRDWEAGERHKLFLAAMVALKLNPPSILKDKTAFTPDGQGGFESYDYATIGNVCEQVIQSAAQHGLTHNWVPGRSPEGDIVVTCEVAHVGGHVQRTMLDAPREESPGLTVAQAEQSVRTFLERYTLLLGFGFAAKDRPDDDGRGGAAMPSPAAQSATEGWVVYVNSADSIETLESIRKEASAAFHAAGDAGAWSTVKRALDARQDALEGGA